MLSIDVLSLRGESRARILSEGEGVSEETCQSNPQKFDKPF